VIAVDVNILVYAFRADLPQHVAARPLLAGLREGDSAWGVPTDVIAGFLRLVTNARVFRTPATLEEALAFVVALRASPSLTLLRPGPRHLDLFLQLCAAARARGKLVPDAWLAAIAVEHGCTWWSSDRDFARFDGLTWEDPLAQAPPSQ